MEKSLNKKSLKSRVAVGILSIVTVVSLGGNIAMINANSAHADTEYVADSYFRPHYAIADPIASTETVAYPTSQQALSNNVSTSIWRGGNLLVMRDSNHQLYNFYATLNTAYTGYFKVQHGSLISANGQIIKMQPVDLSEIKDFAHYGSKDAPNNTLLLTQSDYNYLSNLNGLKVSVN